MKTKNNKKKKKKEKKEKTGKPRLSEALYQNFISNAPSFIGLKDMDGRILLTNRVYAEVFGLKSQNVVGKKIADIHSARVAAEAIAHDRKVIETKSIVTEEREIPGARGIRTFVVTKFPVLDKTGSIKGIGVFGTDISDLKRIEQQLSETQRQLQGIVDNIPGTVFRRVLKKDGTEAVEFSKGRMLSEFGIDENAPLLGRHILSDFTIPEDRGIRARAIRESAATLGPCDYQIRIRKNTGEIVWMRSISRPYRRDGGDIVWDGVVLDVTASGRAEEELKNSEERYRAIVENQTEMVRKCAPDGVRTFVNEAYCRNFGTAREDIEGTITGSHVIDEDRPVWRKHFKNIKADNPTVDVEVRVRGARGEIRWHHWIDTGIFDKKGNLVEILGIGRDITDRKLVEEALRRSEERLRGAVESMQEGFALYDADDRLVALNDEYARVNPAAWDIMECGGTFEDVIRANVARGVIAEAIGREEAFIRERLARHRRPKGPIIRRFAGGNWYMIRESPTPEGGVALSFMDITELKRAEEQLIGLQESLAHMSRLVTMGEMAAELAHELNQPLSAIANYANGSLRRMKEERMTAAELKPIMETIAGQALRAGEIIHELKGFMSRAAPQKVPIDSRRTIDEVLALFAGRIREGGIEVVVRVPGALPPVMADKVQIQQVLLNLVRNALTALCEEGVAKPRLRIAVKEAAGGGIEFRVKDNGPGLAPGLAEHIFDPFFTTKADGMGMGLPISRSIVTGHEGRLWVTSRPGEGACFHFTLPAA